MIEVLINGKGSVLLFMNVFAGVISNFMVSTEGDVWVELSWSITPSDLPIHHYDITINSAITQQNFCSEVRQFSGDDRKMMIIYNGEKITVLGQKDAVATKDKNSEKSDSKHKRKRRK